MAKGMTALWWMDKLTILSTDINCRCRFRCSLPPSARLLLGCVYPDVVHSSLAEESVEYRSRHASVELSECEAHLNRRRKTAMICIPYSTTEHVLRSDHIHPPVGVQYTTAAAAVSSCFQVVTTYRRHTVPPFCLVDSRVDVRGQQRENERPP